MEALPILEFFSGGIASTLMALLGKMLVTALEGEGPF